MAIDDSIVRLGPSPYSKISSGVYTWNIFWLIFVYFRLGYLQTLTEVLFQNQAKMMMILGDFEWFRVESGLIRSAQA